MPSIIMSRAPWIARAVALPPDGLTIGSFEPWITSVGALIVRRSAVRSPEATIAPSCLPMPAGSCPRSYDRRSISRTRSRS